MYTTIRLAGRGGDGIKFAGTILGEAAIASGYHATQIAAYTPSTRGGPIHTDVIFSDEKIACPYVESPDILVVLSEKAWLQHSKDIEPDAYVIYNSNTVRPNIITHRPDRVIAIPLDSMAAEHTPKLTPNLILIGYVARLLDLESTDLNWRSYDQYIVSSHPVLSINSYYLERAIEKVSPERFLPLNKQAFKIGYEKAKADGVSFVKKEKS